MIVLRIDAQRGVHHIDVDLHLAAPWTVIVGDSGSGKTSILRAICGLWTPAAARVSIDGTDVSTVSSQRRFAAYVAQAPALFPNMTALGNLQFGKRIPRPDEEEDRIILRRFHAEQLADRKPAELSAGEQQRVSLARAAASTPRLLLLDEALSGTDHTLRSELIEALKAWQRESAAQIISVTHDLMEAVACADEVVLLREGKVVSQGPPREVLQARLQEVRAIL